MGKNKKDKNFYILGELCRSCLYYWDETTVHHCPCCHNGSSFKYVIREEEINKFYRTMGYWVLGG